MDGKIAVSNYKIVILRQKTEMAKKVLLLWFSCNHYMSRLKKS
jgi:hypothetical protein